MCSSEGPFVPYEDSSTYIGSLHDKRDNPGPLPLGSQSSTNNEGRKNINLSFTTT
ncbi:hypothetical protein DPMN_106605 [Dreissena polymorpha]|uniref:Uncharacterized protein n=1 Tax=Dreissena polymorpha TaxID=45954 RepID=A0A9D4K5I5_DREPO|nr:hypothetical protein DPMN_106605 [Dreissena polymorpha]